MRNVLLIVCASVACYKAAEVVRRLRDGGFGAQVAMTPDAEKMVGAATFRAVSGRAVLTDEWREPVSPDGMDHIAAVREADAILVAPGTADFIAKAAGGICDNLPLAAFLAGDAPKFIAPAMNAKMWQNPATERNVAQLVRDGVVFLGPDTGEMACGEFGAGRMLEADDIVSQLSAKLSERSPLSGKKVVVNAGATVERLDPMRVLTNMSSGRMGFAVAEAARVAGAEVVVVAAQTSGGETERVRGIRGVEVRRALTGAEMREALLAETADADAFVAVAAVADFRPKRVSDKKIPRPTNIAIPTTLEFVSVPDILTEITRARPGMIAIGFAAETGTPKEMVDSARRKMREKGAHMFVANSAEDAGRDDCQLTLVTGGDEEVLPRQPKSAAARALVSRITAILENRPVFEAKRKVVLSIIYRAEHRASGLAYIGKTNRSLEERRKTHEADALGGSRTQFHKAIREHGPDAFAWSVYAEVEPEFAAIAEREAIVAENSIWPNGFNTAAATMKGVPLSPAHRAAIRAGKPQPREKNYPKNRAKPRKPGPPKI